MRVSFLISQAISGQWFPATRLHLAPVRVLLRRRLSPSSRYSCEAQIPPTGWLKAAAAGAGEEETLFSYRQSRSGAWGDIALLTRGAGERRCIASRRRGREGQGRPSLQPS